MRKAARPRPTRPVGARNLARNLARRPQERHRLDDHAEAVLKVDTVRAYHFGTRFLVEVDVVLPEDMPLRQTHDIGEGLQIKLEALDEVQRAFVHIDYEWEHKPEHKKVT